MKLPGYVASTSTSLSITRSSAGRIANRNTCFPSTSVAYDTSRPNIAGMLVIRKYASFILSLAKRTHSQSNRGGVQI